MIVRMVPGRTVERKHGGGGPVTDTAGGVHTELPSARCRAAPDRPARCRWIRLRSPPGDLLTETPPERAPELSPRAWSLKTVCSGAAPRRPASPPDRPSCGLGGR